VRSREDSSPTWKLDLDKWANFSSFLARCAEAGLEDDHKNPCKYFEMDIDDFLEHDRPPGPLRDCSVRVVVQYILLAEGAIRKYAATGSWGLENCQQLANKLKEIADKGDIKESELNSAINKAYEKMASFHPELILVSGRGSNPDP
jgi:Protein of unknown function (DUF3632)